MTEFIFATGVENSYPMTMVKDALGKERPFRRDQMRETLHYDFWKKDFALVRELNISYLRYGPPYYLIQKRSGECNFVLKPEDIGATEKFDMQERLDELHRLNITPIIDLCHFGLPDWVEEGFQDRSWPDKFADYAAAFATKFPNVYLYTPINEIYVTANFSGQLDLWNERKNSEQGFVNALCNLCKANVLAMEAMLAAQPDALFIQSESSEYFHPETEADVSAARFLNAKRFLSLDLSYGHPVDSVMFRYLERNGMSETDYDFFMQPRKQLLQSCVMGNDYYWTNEHWVDGAEYSAQNPSAPNAYHYRQSGEIFGYYVITHQYYDRYKMPIMHTETNRASKGGHPDEALDWFQKQWANVLRLNQDGIPIVGFTWYGLVDLVGWNKLLCNGDTEVVPAGLYALDRTRRKVGDRYHEFIGSWRQEFIGALGQVFNRGTELTLRAPEIPMAGLGLQTSARNDLRGIEPTVGVRQTATSEAVDRGSRTAQRVKALPRGLF